VSHLLYPGCKIPHHLPQYGQSTRAVLGALDLPAAEAELGCCGYPMRRLYPAAHLASAARVLAMAERQADTLLCLCMCCFGTLKQAAERLECDRQARRQVEAGLAAEGLDWRGGPEIEHLTSFLARRLGPDSIREKVVRPLTGLPVASLYGCQAIRPSKVTHYDDPWNPSLLEGLVQAAGAQATPWPGFLECCGDPLRKSNPRLSRAIITRRLEQAAEAGAEVLSLSCPHSALQAAWAWEQATPASRGAMPAVALYPQLLGLALGLGPAELGLERNRPAADRVLAPFFAAGRAAAPQPA
jgi:heterodisulfide reductase subunit B